MQTRSLLTIVASLLLSTFFVSCNKENKEVRTLSKEVTFSTNIASASLRVTDNNWDANDAIGVFMMNVGGVLQDAITPTNAKYITATGGTNKSSFVPADDQNKLLWPEGANPQADFIAYYPYSTDVAGGRLAMNAADQTNFAAIDYLYSATSTQTQSATANPTLYFKHVMPLLVFEFTDKDGAAIPQDQIVGMKINGLQVAGKLDLSDGTVTPEGAATEFATKGTSALVIPQTTPASMVVTFQHNSKDYSWDLGTKTFEQGKKYTFKAKLTDGVVPVSGIDGEISDREPGDTVDGIELDPTTPTGPTTPTEPTTLTADATTYAIEAAGGSHDFVISTDAAAITATSDATWATVPSGEIAVDGTGKATLSVTVAANETNMARNATITVNHNGVLRAAATPIVITISQAAKEAVTPTPDPTEGDLIISALSEGKGNDKYIKISNRTGRDIDLASYTIRQYNNGKIEATGNFELKLSGTLKAGEFLVAYNKQASFKDFPNAAQSIEDTTFTISFNGDDAVSLAKDGADIDLFGVIGNAKGNSIWADKIYIRKDEIKTPSATFNEAEWTVEAMTVLAGSSDLFKETFNKL